MWLLSGGKNRKADVNTSSVKGAPSPCTLLPSCGWDSDFPATGKQESQGAKCCFTISSLFRIRLRGKKAHNFKELILGLVSTAWLRHKPSSECVLPPIEGLGNQDREQDGTCHHPRISPCCTKCAPKARNLMN